MLTSNLNIALSGSVRFRVFSGIVFISNDKIALTNADFKAFSLFQ